MSIERSDMLDIRTAEGVTFSLRLAGPSGRFFAWLIDVFIVACATYVIGKLLMSLAVFFTDHATAANAILFFALQVGYPILFEWFWRGQTIGKRITGLRVADAQGLQLQFSQILVRNLLRVVDGLPRFYLVGGVAMLSNRYNQRLGDLAANTVVVRAPRPLGLDFERVLPGKYNSFRDHPHVEARLRQRVGPEEAAIAVEALLRRDLMDPARRVSLYSELAAHFKPMAKFPESITDGLTDEQYLRNVVDTVFRQRQRSEVKRAAS